MSNSGLKAWTYEHWTDLDSQRRRSRNLSLVAFQESLYPQDTYCCLCVSSCKKNATINQWVMRQFVQSLQILYSYCHSVQFVHDKHSFVEQLMNDQTILLSTTQRTSYCKRWNWFNDFKWIELISNWVLLPSREQQILHVPWP